MVSSFDEQPGLPLSMQLMPIGALAVIVISMLSGAKRFSPNPAYVHAALSLGAVASLLLAWRLQPKIVGCWYKPRFGDRQPYSELGAWGRALANAVLAVLAAGFLLAAVGNTLLGTSRSEIYFVTSRYVTHGRWGSCYGVRLQRRSDASDRVHLCLDAGQQSSLAVGSRLAVIERSSWFGRQVQSYAPVAPAGG